LTSRGQSRTGWTENDGVAGQGAGPSPSGPLEAVSVAIPLSVSSESISDLLRPKASEILSVKRLAEVQIGNKDSSARSGLHDTTRVAGLVDVWYVSRVWPEVRTSVGLGTESWGGSPLDLNGYLSISRHYV